MLIGDAALRLAKGPGTWIMLCAKEEELLWTPRLGPGARIMVFAMENGSFLDLAEALLRLRLWLGG